MVVFVGSLAREGRLWEGPAIQRPGRPSTFQEQCGSSCPGRQRIFGARCPAVDDAFRPERAKSFMLRGSLAVKTSGLGVVPPA